MEALALANIVEAIIFVAPQPVKKAFILDIILGKTGGEERDTASTGAEGEPTKHITTLAESEGAAQEEGNILPVPEVNEEILEEVLQHLLKKYEGDAYPFGIKAIAEGYQFYTKEAYYPFVKYASLTRNKKRLSKVALETLSIIAYRQPVTKAEIEFIRGVNSDYAVQKLLEKKLISIVGRSEAPGRPLLYGTSSFFFQYFGVKDMNDLPKLKEFEATESEHLELFKKHQEEKLQDHEKEESEQQQPEEQPES